MSSAIIKSKTPITLRKLFPDISEQEIHKIQASSNLITVHKGQNLFIAGDHPRALYGVAKGFLKIVREGVEGDSILTRLVSAGQFLGIREIIGELKYSRSAAALTDSEIFAIDAKVVREMSFVVPRLSKLFMQMLCTELTSMESRIEAVLYRPAKNRVMATFYELFDLFSETGKENDSFYFPLTRRDIAELSDVKAETVSRILSELKQTGVIDCYGQNMKILDMGAFLQEIV